MRYDSNRYACICDCFHDTFHSFYIFAKKRVIIEMKKFIRLEDKKNE